MPALSINDGSAPSHQQEVAGQPQPDTANFASGAHAVKSPTLPIKRTGRWLSTSRTVHFLVVALLFVVGVGLLWLTTLAYTTNEGLQHLSYFYSLWKPATQALFLIAFAVLFFRIARLTIFYPLVVFFISLEAVQQVTLQIIRDGGQPLVDAVSKIFRVNDLTLYLFIIGLYTLIFAAGTALIATARLGTAVAEDFRRRRIQTYFESRPVWPLVASGLAVILVLFSITGQYDSKEWLFLVWKDQLVGASFAFSALWLLFDDKRRRSFYYFNLFVIFFFIGSQILDYLIGYPYAIHEFWMVDAANQIKAGQATEQDRQLFLDPYYRKYWIIVAGLTLAYAVIFRFFLFPRFHLATDAEVDAIIAEDLKPAMNNAFERFGIERKSLIAEPAGLRSFPNRQSISGAFTGSRIGHDDHLRFTPQTSVIIAFTEEQAMFYERTVDLTTGTAVNETTVELFYQDISNVERVSTTHLVDARNTRSWIGRLLGIFSRRRAEREREISDRTVNDKLQLPGRDVFQISLSGGRNLLIILRDTTFFDVKKARIVQILTGMISAASAAQTDPNIDLPMDENERVIRNIRTTLRDKKRALLWEHR
jgi:hypothetical protein